MPDAEGWHIRPAHPDDREWLVGLASRLGSGFALPPGLTAGEIEEAEARTLAAALDHLPPDTALLVAEREGIARGGVIYVQAQADYFRPRPNAHVAILAVGADVEGQGAGRALLDAAESWARGRGSGMITLHVFTDNARARAVYERHGFMPEIVRYVKWL